MALHQSSVATTLTLLHAYRPGVVFGGLVAANRVVRGVARLHNPQVRGHRARRNLSHVPPFFLTFLGHFLLPSAHAAGDFRVVIGAGAMRVVAAAMVGLLLVGFAPQ